MKLDEIQEQLDNIAKLQNGGINEYAQKEILTLMKFIYLSGIQEGMDQAEKILK